MEVDNGGTRVVVAFFPVGEQGRHWCFFPVFSQSTWRRPDEARGRRHGGREADRSRRAGGMMVGHGRVRVDFWQRGQVGVADR
jgi:hypothetical protein